MWGSVVKRLGFRVYRLREEDLAKDCRVAQGGGGQGLLQSTKARNARKFSQQE